MERDTSTKSLSVRPDTSAKSSSMRPPSTALSMRPPSAVIMSRTALMSATSRPITQQGLSGLRPTQTSSGLVNRIHHDKRYWMSLIQTHMNKIREEMFRLKKENDEFRIKTIHIEELKKTAQDHAKKIEEQQELLAVYNSALEMHLSKTKEEEIIAETEQIKRQNEMKFKEIDNLFNEKKRLQEKIAKVKKDLEEHDETVKLLVEELSEEDKQKYYSLVAEKDNTEKGIQSLQEDIKLKKEKIDKYKEIISKSSEKQNKLQLLQSQYRLETQKEELTSFLQNTLTPAQQRQTLLQQVKQDKADIESLTKLKATLEEEFALKSERLSELERELDGKDNARLKKHRELRERGEHMDAFINSYEEKATGIRNKMETTRNQVLLALDHIASNITELDLEQFGNVQMDPGDQSLAGYNKRRSLLLSQLDRLKAYKEKFETEILNLKQKQIILRQEIKDFQNIDHKRDQMVAEKLNLTEELSAVTAKLESTEAAVFEIQRQKEDIVKRLEENPSYREIVILEKEIEDLEVKYHEIDEIRKSEMQNKLIDELNNSVDELLNKRNEQLICSLKQKKK